MSANKYISILKYWLLLNATRRLTVDRSAGVTASMRIIIMSGDNNDDGHDDNDDEDCDHCIGR